MNPDLDGKNKERIIIENKINIVNENKSNSKECRCDFEIKSLKKEIEYLKEIVELLKLNSN